MNEPTGQSPLSAAQLQRQRDEIGETLRQLAANVATRRSLLEIAAKVCEGEPAWVVKLAREMLAFLYEPFTEQASILGGKPTEGK